MLQELNQQLNRELYSAYLYLSMSAWFTQQNYSGFALWMKLQSKEEFEHAMKFYHYIHSRGGKVELEQIQKPKNSWQSPLEAYEDTYKSEQEVTQHIHNLVKLAKEENDYATEVFLQWFVSEQVDEEAAADEIVQQLKMIGDSPQALFLIDKKAGKRKE